MEETRMKKKLGQILHTEQMLHVRSALRTIDASEDVDEEPSEQDRIRKRGRGVTGFLKPSITTTSWDSALAATKTPINTSKALMALVLSRR